MPKIFIISKYSWMSLKSDFTSYIINNDYFYTINDFWDIRSERLAIIEKFNVSLLKHILINGKKMFSHSQGWKINSTHKFRENNYLFYVFDVCNKTESPQKQKHFHG